MPMSKITEGPRNAGFILSEASGNRSRDNIKIAAGAGLVKPGAILGKVTASGKFVPHNPAAADGSQTAVAINYAAADATDKDQVVVGITRDAEVKEGELIYHADTNTDAEKDAVHASLAAVGIIVR